MTIPRLRGSRRWAAVATLVSAAPSGLVRAADGTYRMPKDYATEWAKNITVALAVAAICLLLYTLLVRRGRIAPHLSRWLLFLGIGVAPFPVMVLSSAVGLEQAKAVTFCDSCHSMAAFVADMEDPRSERLAALHFKNRYIQDHHCYTCHTDYGLFGTVEAKVGGLTHIWRDAAGSYRLPVTMRERYRFTICLNCHGQSQKFTRQRAHAGVPERVMRNEATCTDCHGPSHPRPEERSRLS